MGLESEQAEHVYGRLARISFIAVGGVFILAALAFVALIVFVLRRDLPIGISPGFFMFLLVAALLAVGIGTYGSALVRRGWRGRTVPSNALERAERRLRRVLDGHPFAFTLFTAGVITFLSLAHGPAPLRAAVVQSGPWWRLVTAVVFPLLFVPAHVLVHEFGHALAALAVGLRFQSLRVGSVELVRNPSGYRLQWAGLSVFGALGLHTAFPGERKGVGRLAVYALAGPLATLLASAACWRVACGEVASTGDALIRGIAWAGAWFGALLAFGNLVPARVGALTSDGGVALAALRFVALPRTLQVLAVAHVQRTRAREWPLLHAEVLAEATRAGAHRSTFILVALSMACDRREEDKIDELLALIASEPALREQAGGTDLQAHEALLATRRGAVAQARALLASIRSRPAASTPMTPLVEAAIALAEGRRDEARPSFEEWLRRVRVEPDGPQVRVGHEWAEDEVAAALAS